jgi:uncharacterized protein
VIDRVSFQKRIDEAVTRAGVCDVHEHLLGRAQRAERDPGLLDWIGSSYLWADLISAGLDPSAFADKELTAEARWSELERVLPAVRHTGYMEVCRHGWRDLCGMEGPHLCTANWHGVDRALRANNRDMGFSGAVLSDRCAIKHLLVDYQVGGTAVHFFGQRQALDWYEYLIKVRPTLSDASVAEHTVVRELDLDLCRPVVKIDSLFYGWLPQTAAENHGLLACDTAAARSLDAYSDLISQTIDRLQRGGAVGLKTAHNCCRSPVLGPVDRTAAEAVLKSPASSVCREQIIAFENFVMHEVAVNAARHHLPLQVHTGTTYGPSGLSSARAGGAELFADLVQAHPGTTFVLMHASWPDWGRIEQMAKRYPNVVLDFSWAIMLGPREARRMFQSMFTSVPGNKLIWGGDCYYVEESYGALRQAKRVVSEALADLAEDDVLGEQEAVELAVGLFCTNGPRIYRLEYSHSNVASHL